MCQANLLADLAQTQGHKSSQMDRRGKTG